MKIFIQMSKPQAYSISYGRHRINKEMKCKLGNVHMTSAIYISKKS